MEAPYIKPYIYVSQGAVDVVVRLDNTSARVALARHIVGVLRPTLYPALIRELHSNPLGCLVDLGEMFIVLLLLCLRMFMN